MENKVVETQMNPLENKIFSNMKDNNLIFYGLI
jgi:hypothetical protein